MSAVLDELNRVVGGLPPDLAREVLDFARFLEQRRTQPIVEYGEWTEEEMREASVDSLRRFDAEHANDDWSGLLDDQESGNAPPR
jgi:Protein of unknown function (DUF2281)